MQRTSPIRGPLTAAVVTLMLALGACVDAPSAPEGAASVPGPFLLAPVFSLVSSTGPAVTPAQASALGDAFDRVDHFRMIVKKADGTVVLDTLIEVPSGQDEYDLKAEIPATAGESFLVTLIALEGTTELFKAESIPVTAAPPDGAGSTPPPAVDIPLTYTGPGATAVSVEVAPGQVVLGQGGTAQMGAKVLDDQGAVIAGALVSWSSTAAGVATISASGEVTGVADGIAEVVATSPTGLTARAWVYVVSGALAYVQGGKVMVRAPAGGEAQARTGGSGAQGPTWFGDDLYYSESGSVRKAGSSTTLLSGSWPSVSPDGSKIAADAGGSLIFANLDGTNATEGPSGSTPVWTDWSTLVVGGGSIQRVEADGRSRTTLVGGDASLPAFSNGGTLAYVSDGKLRIEGRGDALADVGGRPSWSPDGAWIVAPGGGGLLLVPTGGSAPPVALPDLEGASDPAWQGTSVSGGSPPGLALTRLDPDPAIPGQEVSLVGSGFDWIIPANNKVFWPGPDGAIAGDVISVTPTAIRSVLPRSVVAGQIRVEGHQGANALLEYVPSLGSLEVHASTPWGTPVGGVTIALLNAAGNQVAAGATDSDGAFVADGIVTGAHTLQIGAPSGFTLAGEASLALTITAAVSTVDLTLTPAVASVTLSPQRPTLGVLDEVGVVVTPFDVNGDPIPEVSSVSWASASSGLDVWSSDGLSTTIVGRKPSSTIGDAGFAVTINGQTFGFAATVTSSIIGTITNFDESPASKVVVDLEQGEADIAKTTTDNAGRYQFSGLLAGSYVVRPEPPTGSSLSPASTSVYINTSNPSGKADFTLIAGYSSGAGEVIVSGDINYWGSYGYFQNANNREMTRNFVTNGGRTKTVWYQGHNSYSPSSYSATGYFSEAYNYITGTLGQTIVNPTSGTTGSLSIPSDAASFWIWMPQAAFDAADVAAINAYLAGGGRVILIGENNGFYQVNTTVQGLMNALGSGGVYQPACYSGTTSDVLTDPLTVDVASISSACTSYFNAGPGDEPLVRQNGNPILMRLRLGAPEGVAPLSTVAPSLTTPLVQPGGVPTGDPALGGAPPPDPGKISRR